MSTPEQLRRQSDAVSRVRAARVQRDKADKAAERAKQKFKQAILDAVSTDAAVRDIAIAAGLSPQRIYQIIKNANED
jgi:hypothetical protein